jgi:peroxiredoxin
MVKTASTMLPLGTKAPDFSLINAADGRTVSMSDFRDQTGLLVIFMCNHCPFVKHIAQGLAQFACDYQPRGLAIVGISSNDAAKYPDDGPDKMKLEAQQQGYPFPYLYDESQSVAQAYRAACTPDFFLFDRDRRLVYRGQFDASRPDSGIPVTGEDMRRAADAVLAGKAVTAEQRPSIGCNIKWKPGLEPEYFNPAGVH